MTALIRIAIVLVLAAAALAIPSLAAPEPGAPPAVEAPPVAYCPVQQDSGHDTTVALAANGALDAGLTTYASGLETGSAVATIGPGGGSTVSIGDVSALGIGAALVEFDGFGSAGSVTTGSTSLAAGFCPRDIHDTTLLGGGSTLSGRSFSVQLMNPFAGEGIVDLVVQSDAGLESSDDLEAIIVPARSSVVVDLGETLPGRDWLTVAVEVTQGAVVAVGRQGIGDDEAVWNAVSPGQDWFVVVPHGLETHRVFIAGYDTPVEYQVDVYTPDGLLEAFAEGEVGARGRGVIDVGEVTPVASAVRVVTTGPVAVFLQVASGTGVALTEAVPAPSPSWLLPGAGLTPGESSYVVVLNPGLEDVTATLTPLGPGGEALELIVPAEDVVEASLGETSVPGYRVEADGDIVVGWTAMAGGAIASASGSSLSDG